MKIIKKYHNNIWLHSTTPLISCKRYTDEELSFILEQFNYLEISVEGYNEESYKSMGGIDGYNLFKEQIYRVKHLIEKNNFKVVIELAFRTCNQRELRGSDFYKEMRNYFTIKEIRDCFFDWFGSIKKEDMPKGAKLMLANNMNKRINCVVPSATLAVQATGKVVGCGCIDWLDKYVIGNCNQDTLQKIWTGKRALKFRNAFKNGKLPSICKRCGLYTSIDCLENQKFLTYKSIDGLYYCQKSKSGRF
jgi:radical SAM protein with 4Fe4S-binding SPASM domain